MSSNYSTSDSTPAVRCEKCKSTRTNVTEVTTYGQYYRCTSCNHAWYAQTTVFKFAD